MKCVHFRAPGIPFSLSFLAQLICTNMSTYSKNVKCKLRNGCDFLCLPLVHYCLRTHVWIVNTHARMHARPHARTHAQARTHARSHARTPACTHSCIHRCTNASTSMCVHTQASTITNAIFYTCADTLFPAWTTQQNREACLYSCVVSVYAVSDTCGIPAVAPEFPGSIGISEAKPHSWPWQVNLVYPGIGPYCGGAIIDKRWIVTAAKCVR